MSDHLGSRHVRHDGLMTHYLEAGPSSDRARATVLLVHDGWFGADARTLWSPLVPHLADEFRVLAPDMLGFGGTDKAVFFDRSMYAYRAAHLGSFVRTVCHPDERVHGVGTSMGGSILLRDVASPAPRIPLRSVVSVSGSGGPWRSAFGAEQLGTYSGTQEDIARVMAHMADRFDGYDEVIAARHRNTQIPGHVEALLAASVKHPAKEAKRPADDWPAALRNLRVPVTVVAGRHDPLLEQGWEKHFEGVSGLLTTRVIDAKHTPSLDHPDVLAGIIRDTIGRAPESASGERR